MNKIVIMVVAFLLILSYPWLAFFLILPALYALDRD